MKFVIDNLVELRMKEKSHVTRLILCDDCIDVEFMVRKVNHCIPYVSFTSCDDDSRTIIFGKTVIIFTDHKDYENVKLAIQLFNNDTLDLFDRFKH